MKINEGNVCQAGIRYHFMVDFLLRTVVDLLLGLRLLKIWVYAIYHAEYEDISDMILYRILTLFAVKGDFFIYFFRGGGSC